MSFISDMNREVMRPNDVPLGYRVDCDSRYPVDALCADTAKGHVDIDDNPGRDIVWVGATAVEGGGCAVELGDKMKLSDSSGGADDDRRELIRAADADVMETIGTKSAVVDGLKARFADADIPDWVYRKAIANEGDPETAICDFVREYGNLYGEYGSEISGDIIRAAMMNNEDAGRVLGERISILRESRERYGGIVADDSLQQGAILGSRPAESLTNMVGAEVLEQIRSEHRAHRRGSVAPARPLKESYSRFESWLASYAKEVQMSSSPSGVIDLDRAMRSFKAGFVRLVNGSNLARILDDRAVLAAAWGMYWDDVLKLQSVGLAGPDIIASYNNSEVLARRILDSDQPKRDIALADSRPSAPLQRIDQYHATVRDLTDRFGGKRYVTKAMIHHIAKGYPTDPVGAIEDHIRKLHEVREVFHDVPEVTAEVYDFLGDNFYVSPEQYVIKYLERRVMLTQLFRDDPDFTDTALTELSLATNFSEREQLKYYGECYKERLSELRNKVLTEGHTIDDIHLVSAAARKVPTMTARFNYAKLLQHIGNERAKRAIRFEAPISSAEPNGNSFEGILADPSAMATEEIAVERLTIAEGFDRIRPALDGCTWAERMLLLYKVAGVVAQVDEAALMRQLKTNDLDEYLENLLGRLRKQLASPEAT